MNYHIVKMDGLKNMLHSQSTMSMPAPYPIIIGGFVGSKSQMHCGKASTSWLMEFVCAALNEVIEGRKERPSNKNSSQYFKPNSMHTEAGQSKIKENITDMLFSGVGLSGFCTESAMQDCFRKDMTVEEEFLCHSSVPETMNFGSVVTSPSVPHQAEFPSCALENLSCVSESDQSDTWTEDISSCWSEDNSESEESEEETYPIQKTENMTNLIHKTRFPSECSQDSTESCDSFIIFDEPWNIDELDNQDTSDGEFDVCFEDPLRLEHINQKWNASYGDDSPVEESKKSRVKFSDHVKVHHMIAWDFAYRQARLGPWEQMARDRDRFRCRIVRLEPELSKILKPSHRRKILRNIKSLSC